VAPANRRTDTDAILDAVRDCVLAVGVRRTTLSDVARRAGVSRMTLYRTWPDVRTLVFDLMTRELQEVTDAALAAAGKDARAGVVASVVATTRNLRHHPFLQKIIEVDPELLLPYLFDRRGASQDYFLQMLTGVLAAGQREGSVRAGEPAVLARSILLVAQAFTLSAGTMATGKEPDDGDVTEALDAELTHLLDRYLAP